MINEVHRENSRGITENEWLNSRHSFSFANYYNPIRMGVGKLRVLNDDSMLPDKGFDNHPHSNMEIVSLPLSGALRHKDNMGNQHVINAGEVQIMSAGRRVIHSEFNHSSNQTVNFLQIWILPKILDIEARYEQKSYDKNKMHNCFHPIVSSRAEDKDAVWINQDAVLSLAKLDENTTIHYSTAFNHSVVYFFVIEGEVNIQGEILHSRDAIALSQLKTIEVMADKSTQILCIETIQ